MAGASKTQNELSIHSGTGCSDAAWRQEGAGAESGVADGPLGQAGEKGHRCRSQGKPCCNLGSGYIPAGTVLRVCQGLMPSL